MHELSESATQPCRVSIALPVYNGENYIDEAIQSILAQTFEDFELIITDNASTDGTAEICQHYAALDARICYYRNAQNLGAARNYNYAFSLARGTYFKWSAHDDIMTPDYLEKCVAVLDADPTVVLCYTQTQIIDEQGRFVEIVDNDTRLDDPEPQVRFADFITDHKHCFPCFGLGRTEELRKTRLIGPYLASDKVFIAETCLLGRLHKVPEPLFLRRTHPEQFSKSELRTRPGWFDPRKAGRIPLRRWRLLLEYARAVSRMDLPLNERLACYFQLLRWSRFRWRALLIHDFRDGLDLLNLRRVDPPLSVASSK